MPNGPSADGTIDTGAGLPALPVGHDRYCDT